jgi:hypothetical protein
MSVSGDHPSPHHQTLMTVTEMVPEKSIIFKKLPWPTARDDFINFNHRENIRPYDYWLLNKDSTQ